MHCRRCTNEAGRHHLGVRQRFIDDVVLRRGFLFRLADNEHPKLVGRHYPIVVVSVDLQGVEP